MGVEKRRVAGGNIIFRRGGGINIVFGPKYRPQIVTGKGKEKKRGKYKRKRI